MGNIKDNLATLLNKEMDRKEFLRYIAAAGITLAGAGMIMQSLLNLDRSRNAKQTTGLSASDYGGGAYGGKLHA